MARCGLVWRGRAWRDMDEHSKAQKKEHPSRGAPWLGQEGIATPDSTHILCPKPLVGLMDTEHSQDHCNRLQDASHDLLSFRRE